MNARRLNRQAGSLLFECLLAITILTIGVLSFVGSFFSNCRAVQAISEIDAASSSITTVAEMLSAAEISEVYSNYHGRSVVAPDLKAEDGGPARVWITCYVDETQLPTAFSAVTDIDGDAGANTPNASATYEILPVQLALTYQGVDGPKTQELYMILYSD